MKLDLGCGLSNSHNYVGIDIRSVADPISDELREPDVYANLNEGIPIASGSCDEIIANHVLEHLKSPLFILDEIYRVCIKGAQVHVEVPLFEVSFYGNGKIRFFTMEGSYIDYVIDKGDMPLQIHPIHPVQHLWAFFPLWFDRNLDPAKWAVGERRFVMKSNDKNYICMGIELRRK